MSTSKQKLTWTLSCLTMLTGCSSFYSGKEYSALQINPVMNVRHADTSAENLYHLGRYHHRKTSYANAIAAYQKALTVNPDYVAAHNGLGVVYASQGQYDLALEHLHKAIELTPSATYLYNNLGYAYLIQGHYSEAVVAFQEAIHLDPHNQKASRNLATAHKQMGSSEQVTIAPTVAHAAQKSEAMTVTATIPQALPVQPSTGQSLVRIAPNVYEFSNHHEKNQIESIAAPLATPAAAPLDTPVTASLTLSPVELSPIEGNQAENTVPEKNLDAIAHSKRIEVSNGNGVTGMARNIAIFLERFGYDNARLTNHPTFQQAETEIHYHPSAHKLAEQISQIMPNPVKMVESNDLREDTQLKILLGQDIASQIAYFTPQDSVQLAKLTSEIQ